MTQRMRTRNGGNSMRTSVIKKNHIYIALLWLLVSWCAANPAVGEERKLEARIVGDLVVAPFEMVARVSVGHRTEGFEMTLPYIPDLEIRSDEEFPLYAHSPALNLTVNVRTSEEQGDNPLQTCMERTRKRVSAQLGEQTISNEASDSQHPAIWRYRYVNERMKALGVYQYNIWNFHLRESKCYRVRMGIVMKPSQQDARRVNRLIRLLSTFRTDYTERVRLLEEKIREHRSLEQPPKPEPLEEVEKANEDAAPARGNE